jgi:hypothetical protein
VHTLFSRPFDASAPATQLTPAGQRSAFFRVSQDNSTAIFATWNSAGEDMNLYRASIDGNLVTPILISDDSHHYQFQGAAPSPDGHYTIFRTDYRIRVIKTDGSSAPASLSPFPDGVERQTFISPNSQWVATISRQSEEGAGELFISPIDASAPPRKLNPPLSAGGDIGGFAFTPDSSHIIYIGKQQADDPYDMFSVLVDGSVPPVRVAGAGSLVISADGKYLITQLIDPSGLVPRSFVAIPIDGGAPVELIRNPYGTSGALFGGVLTPDGSTLLFTYDAGDTSELFAIAIPEPALSTIAIFAAILFRGRRQFRCKTPVAMITIR